MNLKPSFFLMLACLIVYGFGVAIDHPISIFICIIGGFGVGWSYGMAQEGK